MVAQTLTDGRKVPDEDIELPELLGRANTLMHEKLGEGGVEGASGEDDLFGCEDCSSSAIVLTHIAGRLVYILFDWTPYHQPSCTVE